MTQEKYKWHKYPDEKPKVSDVYICAVLIIDIEDEKEYSTIPLWFNLDKGAFYSYEDWISNICTIPYNVAAWIEMPEYKNI